MKKMFTLLLAAFTVALFAAGCGQKHQPIEIEGLDIYQDPAVSFSLKYPKNWWTTKIPGANFSVYSSKDAAGRFSKYDSDGLPGARIMIQAYQLDSMTIEDVVKKVKIFESSAYKGDAKVTLDGVEATKLTYDFQLEDGAFNGEIYIAAKDSGMATVIKFEAFAGAFEKYKTSFGEILASMKLAQTKVKRPDTVHQVVEADPPSQNLTARKGTGYSISIPENFHGKTVTGRNAIFSENYIGDRRGDCNIQVDVKDASKQKDLGKIVDDYKKVISGAGAPVSTNLGGLKASYIPYSVKTKDGLVKARIYFAVKGDKLFQITMNWFTGEEQNYLPIFEKSIASVKFD